MIASLSRHSPVFIDTHCHLFWPDFAEDLPQVIARARAAGVWRMIIPATDFVTFHQAVRIAEHDEDVFLAVGIHPHDAGMAGAGFVEELHALARHPRVVAIGEIGLDYHYDFCSPAVQQRVLHRQLEAAKELHLPVILHNRESDEDLLAVVREHQNGSLRGQFHCFSSDAAYALRVLESGFHISFTGNVTFKRSTLDPVLSLVPDNRLLLETDAPFMAPVPFRGKRNEPGYLPRIAGKFAEVRHQTVEHVASVTTSNAMALFPFPNSDTTEKSDE
ncbi:MAG: TatD family hydrolase [Bacteroidetes bacterium]|nr:TatD family hydrolase [Bacteroidota bacterium]